MDENELSVNAEASLAVGARLVTSGWDTMGMLTLTNYKTYIYYSYNRELIYTTLPLQRNVDA